MMLWMAPVTGIPMCQHPFLLRDAERRVEGRGAMAWATWHRSVSPPRSSNRTCRFPASGSPTGFTARHTADGHFRLVSRDDAVARDQPSPYGRAPSEAFGYLQVLPGSSPITDPRLLRKRARNQGPFLRRHLRPWRPSSMLLMCGAAPFLKARTSSCLER